MKTMFIATTLSYLLLRLSTQARIAVLILYDLSAHLAHLRTPFLFLHWFLQQSLLTVQIAPFALHCNTGAFVGGLVGAFVGGIVGDLVGGDLTLGWELSVGAAVDSGPIAQLNPSLAIVNCSE